MVNLSKSESRSYTMLSLEPDIWMLAGKHGISVDTLLDKVGISDPTDLSNEEILKRTNEFFGQSTAVPNVVLPSPNTNNEIIPEHPIQIEVLNDPDITNWIITYGSRDVVTAFNNGSMDPLDFIGEPNTNSCKIAKDYYAALVRYLGLEFDINGFDTANNVASMAFLFEAYCRSHTVDKVVELKARYERARLLIYKYGTHNVKVSIDDHTYAPEKYLDMPMVADITEARAYYTAILHYLGLKWRQTTAPSFSDVPYSLYNDFKMSILSYKERAKAANISDEEYVCATEFIHKYGTVEVVQAFENCDRDPSKYIGPATGAMYVDCKRYYDIVLRWLNIDGNVDIPVLADEAEMHRVFMRCLEGRGTNPDNDKVNYAILRWAPNRVAELWRADCKDKKRFIGKAVTVNKHDAISYYNAILDYLGIPVDRMDLNTAIGLDDAYNEFCKIINESIDDPVAIKKLEDTIYYLGHTSSQKALRKGSKSISDYVHCNPTLQDKQIAEYYVAVLRYCGYLK